MKGLSKDRFELVAFFTVRENYGAHCWDGEGDCPQAWKNKGTTEKIIESDLSREQAVDLLIKGQDTYHTVMNQVVLREMESSDDYAQIDFYRWEIKPKGWTAMFNRHDLSLEDWHNLQYIDVEKVLRLDLLNARGAPTSPKLGDILRRAYADQ